MSSLALDRGAIASVVERAVAGDEVAFARIVATYHLDLIRVAFVICRDERVAEDAAQAAWWIAWRKLGSLRDPERLKPWLVAVAANEARHLARRERSHGVVELAVVREPFTAADSAKDPAREIDTVDLANALAHLKAEDRALVAMRYVADLDSSELARVLGMSASGVRSRLSRLLDRLRKELGDA